MSVPALDMSGASPAAARMVALTDAAERTPAGTLGVSASKLIRHARMAAEDFAAVAAPNRADGVSAADAAPSQALDATDALTLASLLLPRIGAASSRLPSLPDISVPENIVHDNRRRAIFKLGVLAARALDLNAADFSAEDLIALGRETVVDHALFGDSLDLPMTLARLEGGVDDAAWASQDHARIAAQMQAFLQTRFKDEIDLIGALDGIAAQPALPSRKAMAEQLLRDHGIDPDAPMEGSGQVYAYDDITGPVPALVLSGRAGEFYFNKDALTAADVRRMTTIGGASPSEAQISGMLRELPASLDVEFGKRFDAHRQRMSGLLATWLRARLALHARDVGVELAGATIKIARATIRYYKRVKAGEVIHPGLYADQYGNLPSRGFVVSIQKAGRAHHCFVSSRTGAVQVIPNGMSIDSWLKREHAKVFEDEAVIAQVDPRPGRLRPSVDLQEMASGSQDTMQAWLTGMFQAEIEAEREAVRGQTSAEAGIDMLLNLIPFRPMIVALRKGDIPMAIAMGVIDVLSLVPYVGSGLRLAGAVASSAAPWLGMGIRHAARLGGQGAGTLARLAGRTPGLIDRLRTTLTEWGIHGCSRLRPIDARRVAQALRPTAPKLAGILERMAAGTHGTSIPDGVWRVAASPASAPRMAAPRLASARAPTTAPLGTTPIATTPIAATPLAAGSLPGPPASDVISVAPMAIAHNADGGTLRLLPLGDRPGVYTQVNAAGLRTGAVLQADKGGWLHQTMPIAALARYRVASPATVRALDARRARPDGTMDLDGEHYARIGDAYVQVRQDAAVSTASRPIWRAIAPRGMVPDVVPYRLAYDADEGLWRQADVPGLAGGYRPCMSRNRVCMPDAPNMQVTPSASQSARMRDALVAGMRGASGEQIEAMRALLDRVGNDSRGKAILNALTAHHALLGRVPEIVMREGAAAQHPRPSLARPDRGGPWYLDLQALRYGTTEQAVDELAAVYNDMTGLLQHGDPFQELLADGGPALGRQLERAWAVWIAEGSAVASRSVRQADGSTLHFTQREWTILHLRRQLQELRCHGGLDRSTLKALLRHRHGKWPVKIDLSRRGLDSVPPLPRDTQVLSISGNLIRDWSNLPAGLSSLYAERTGMTELPANLPTGLLYLDVSRNLLRGATLNLPPGLVRLEIRQNRLTSVPWLPPSLKELVVSENVLAELPANLPRGLRTLDASNNVLMELPADLPPGLKILLAANNRLTRLPEVLPAGLRELDISANRLEALPGFPATLRVLDAHSNMLTTLPDDLPAELEMLVVSRNHLWRLPDSLPAGLVFLSAQRNAIERLPDAITALERCRIYLDGNPLALASIPIVGPDRAGPRIYFQAPTGPRMHTLGQAVCHWWTGPSEDAQARWEAIDQTLGTAPEALEFAMFLERLRGTTSYRHEEFRQQVQDWLLELSKPERKVLLQETLGVCAGATTTCDDRIVSAWNDLQVLRRNDDIRQGLYDDRVGDVIGIAREMFRINVLNDIARAKERSLLIEAAVTPDPRSYVDPLEVYLAYAVHLRDALDLRILAPRMRFYDASMVSAEDLAEARETVLAREREEFDRFLVLDYAPWQTLLKRKHAKAYAEAEEAAQRALETEFEPAMEAEIAALGLREDDGALLEDARKDLGPRLMREIRYRAMAPLTRAFNV